MNNFCGKRVLVTGAAQGIGYGITKRLVELGATVVALDVSTEKLGQLKQEFPKIENISVNLKDWNATKKAVTSVFPINHLVNNAGVAIVEPFLEVSEKNFDVSFDVNIKAVFNVTQTVIENLTSTNTPGSIVNISSQASQAALFEHSVYCSSKGAVDAFTRAVALEFGPKNIRINAVNPTVVMTELGRKVWSAPKKSEPMLAKIPMNRFAKIEDVVEAVIFLLSDKASMITGTCLPVDGGFLAC
ncbi:unnamed protein product [Brassicogethes aeneus]|uniref:L-xylulose reductase n=1 Tax=Brassicogethes aeneus TaxID=1431903 RepID=A0A9P0BC97_BRAAE|nr:unnamed protein product [Brassicogethes aeneus]